MRLEIEFLRTLAVRQLHACSLEEQPQNPPYSPSTFPHAFGSLWPRSGLNAVVSSCSSQAYIASRRSGCSATTSCNSSGSERSSYRQPLAQWPTKSVLTSFVDAFG